MTSAIDYSFQRPAPAAIKAAGIAGVIRYVTGKDKALSATEAQSLRANGLWIGLVHEGAAGDALLGRQKGVEDTLADTHALDLILCPRSAVVFYACDTFATVDQVRPYFQGVHSIAARPVGWYGGLGVGLQLHAEGLVDYVWAANATSWSGFATFPELEAAAHAHRIAMLQHLDHPFPSIPASAYDYDEVITPFPAWGFTPQEAPVVPPKLHITLAHPITGYLSIIGVGAWFCTEDGGVFTLAGHFFGSPVGKTYWAGRKASNIVVNPVVAQRAKHPYVIVADTGRTYGLDGF